MTMSKHAHALLGSGLPCVRVLLKLLLLCTFIATAVQAQDAVAECRADSETKPDYGLIYICSTGTDACNENGGLYAPSPDRAQHFLYPSEHPCLCSEAEMRHGRVNGDPECIHSTLNWVVVGEAQTNTECNTAAGHTCWSTTEARENCRDAYNACPGDAFCQASTVPNEDLDGNCIPRADGTCTCMELAHDFLSMLPTEFTNSWPNMARVQGDSRPSGEESLAIKREACAANALCRAYVKFDCTFKACGEELAAVWDSE